MCHEFQRGRCPHTKDGFSYCERGWHISQTEYEEETHATKRTLSSRYADDTQMNKRHRTNTTAQAATEPREWFDRRKKALDRHIYLTRLGFYDIQHFPDETLPHPDEIESAYLIAMEEELPQEEKERKQEAFAMLMRAINGHEREKESELDDN